MIFGPIMVMRTLLLRILLLAAFFNAAVGIPTHEMKHLRELVVAAQQSADAPAIDDTDDESSEHVEAHGFCTWCPAYATQAMAMWPAWAFALPIAALAPHPERTQVAFVLPQGWHWRFAARDPPLTSS